MLKVGCSGSNRSNRARCPLSMNTDHGGSGLIRNLYGLSGPFWPACNRCAAHWVVHSTICALADLIYGSSAAPSECIRPFYLLLYCQNLPPPTYSYIRDKLTSMAVMAKPYTYTRYERRLPAAEAEGRRRALLTNMHMYLLLRSV